MLNDLLSFWALPALLVALGVILADRIESDKCPENYTYADWLFLLLISVIYPFGLVGIIGVTIPYFFRWLVKER